VLLIFWGGNGGRISKRAVSGGSGREFLLTTKKNGGYSSAATILEGDSRERDRRAYNCSKGLEESPLKETLTSNSSKRNAKKKPIRKQPKREGGTRINQHPREILKARSSITWGHPVEGFARLAPHDRGCRREKRPAKKKAAGSRTRPGKKGTFFKGFPLKKENNLRRNCPYWKKKKISLSFPRSDAIRQEKKLKKKRQLTEAVTQKGSGLGEF